MSLISRMRRQEGVYWERLTPDQFGRFSYATPIEIKCRWDDSSAEYRDNRGEKALSQATVYVDRLMKAGDMLKKGELDSDTPADPTTLVDAFEIKGFEQTPNLRATETLYTAHL